MQLCLKGHDKNTLGFTKDQKCAECARVGVKKWRNKHLEESRLKSQLYYRNNPESVRNSALLRNYGITLDHYNQMFAEQNGCCKVCNIHQSELKKRLFVDHNHITGEVRGLLCTKCNIMIGQADDSPVRLRQAADYLS